jgi:hypothetical protein
MKKYKKLVLLEYNNCRSFVQMVTSSKPLTLQRIASYFEQVDGASWDVDSITILNDGKIDTINIDREKVN